MGLGRRGCQATKGDSACPAKVCMCHECEGEGDKEEGEIKEDKRIIQKYIMEKKYIKKKRKMKDLGRR